MPAVLLDTDVTSYLFKKDTRSRRYLRHVRGRERLVSFMALAELDQWAELHRWGARQREAMERFLQGFEVVFADRELCRKWAEVRAGAVRQGRRIDVADAWHAATALALGVPLVTHNPADFAGVEGLEVISEAGGE